MEMNVKKTKEMRISRQPCPVQIMIDEKLDNLEYLNYFSSNIMRQDVHVKLNPGLPWPNKYSTQRRTFSPANWT
jgi:hypothetical protein